MSQCKYGMELLTETGMLACRPADTPIEMNHKLCQQDDQISSSKEQCKRLIGKLIYLPHRRPDIAQVVSDVSDVSQFIHGPIVLIMIVVDHMHTEILEVCTG